MVCTNKERVRRFDQLEARLDKKLTAHDEAITAILAATRALAVTLDVLLCGRVPAAAACWQG